MAETDFQVVYEGPALETGRMPVRDLAPALLALGELFTEAAGILYPDHEPPSLSVKAHERGSFEAHLVLDAKHLWDQVVSIFGSEDVAAIVNLRDVVALVFSLTLIAGGRKIKKRKQVDAGEVRIEFEDGDSVEFSSDALRLYDRLSVRRKARKVVEPLEREGVDRVRYETDNNVVITVSTEQLPAFDVDEPGEVVGESDREIHLSIVSAAFRDGNKWRLSDGATTFWATIDDREFLARVEERRELFGKGDTLRCVLRIVQTQHVDGDLSAEYHVVRVLQHIGRPMQMRIEHEVP